MKIKTIGIITKNADQAVSDTVDKLYDFLTEKSYTLIFDQNAEGLLADKSINIHSREELAEKSDLAIVVGGDGTFLSAVRTLADYNTPVLGINLGRLGFLVDISPDDMIDRLENILSGEYVDDVRFLLHAEIIRKEKVIGESDAFNDVVVHIRDVARMIEFKTYINGQFVNFQRADGMVVSTPTGSTAYALSGGGPLLHATLDAMVLVPICPHTLTNRPLVVNSDSKVEILIDEKEQSTAQVTFDGQTGFDVKPGDRIIIKKKLNKIHLIHPASYDYYEILRAKLSWARQL
ncbi:MAG: NAD(+) kinase [Gammaproteobacteria bacterium]|nr:NAD(+) kinase [Gammaproteobacteria bacterium]MCW9006002.1 NAD(+) kinase [Gammaproteobacteria bacterium]